MSAMLAAPAAEPALQPACPTAGSVCKPCRAVKGTHAEGTGAAGAWRSSDAAAAAVVWSTALALGHIGHRARRSSCRDSWPRVRIRLGAIKEVDLDALAGDFFGISLRQNQREVVQAALRKKDTCVFWSTGSGKSLCYQLIPLVTGKIVIVVSPLIAIMKDQVNKFNACAEKQGAEQRACFLGSGHEDEDERHRIEEAALEGKYQLVYVTPEKLVGVGNMLESLRCKNLQEKIGLLAIDEAHCIQEWGGDFRPEYRDLGWFREEFPDVPIMALTALGTPEVQAHIQTYLGLRHAKVSEGSYFRPNLHLKRSASTGDDVERIAAQIKDVSGRTIIYVRKRDEVDKVTKKLKELLPRLASDATDLKVGSYHAKIAQRQRDLAHEEFASMGGDRVMVATVAYGMGVHFPDVRRVYHLGSPWDVGKYWQQIGRAGRDGKPAICEVISSPSDFAKAVHAQSADSEDWEKKSMQQMRQLLHSQQHCRWARLLRYLGEEPPWPFGDRCGICDVCLAAERAEHAEEELQIDLTDLAAEVLRVLRACAEHVTSGPTMTQLVELLCGRTPRSKGKDRNHWHDVSLELGGAKVWERCRALTGLDTKKRLSTFMQELVEIMASAGYLSRRQLSSGPWFRRRYYEILLLSSAGKTLLDEVDAGGSPKAELPLAHVTELLADAKSRETATRPKQKLAKEGKPRACYPNQRQKELFEFNREQAKKYFSDHPGQWPSCAASEDLEKKVGSWLKRQRAAFLKGTLPQERLQKCLELPEIQRRWAALDSRSSSNLQELVARTA